MVYDVPLNLKEIRVIRYVLERYRKAMLFEIANTDSRTLKEHLREREEVVQQLVHRMDAFTGEPGEDETDD